MKNPIEHNKNLKTKATRTHGEPFEPRKSINSRWGAGMPFADRTHDNMDVKDADPLLTSARRQAAKKVGVIAAGVALVGVAGLEPKGGGETDGWTPGQKAAAEQYIETGELPTPDEPVFVPPAEQTGR